MDGGGGVWSGVVVVVAVVWDTILQRSQGGVYAEEGAWERWVQEDDDDEVSVCRGSNEGNGEQSPYCRQLMPEIYWRQSKWCSREFF